MANILICDDDRDIVNALKIYLSDPDYTLFEAYNGADALNILKRETIHLVLLDIMMPEMNGLAVTAKIRETSNIPIILISAKSEDSDVVLGLNVGADDYITKPFNPLEVSARVHSQLRRYFRLGTGVPEQSLLVLGAIELDDDKKEVRVDGELVNLTPKEYDILKLLMSNPGKVYSPKQIFDVLWKEKPMDADKNLVAVHIRHLREKIEINPAEPRYIKVVFGKGYKFEIGDTHV
ncbi:MAG: response regulator transcription factor [Clostridia bacterium]|nr:response regulator transcription factor [Clostridia bacterium]MBQ3927479.1 response regulator transcription factor [Clostridia bacterium]MBQ7728691.1 response regulator transcription factor [Clostridia bacterium]